MIRDDRQYRAMQERVIRFRLALTSMETANALNDDPLKRQASIDAMRAQLDALERELQAYDAKRNRSEGDR